MQTRGINGRWIIAIVMALISLVGYYSSTTTNNVTGEKQHVSGITPEQEIALGLQAAPQMAQEYGGLSDNTKATAMVERVGAKLVAGSDASKTPYKYDFHLLADEQTINAFALPGGQVFITMALMRRFKTEGQLAGVLGHEITHVVARHSAEQIAKQKLTQGLTGAAALAAYDPNNPASRNSAQIAALVGGLVNMKFGRNDELESDRYGVRFMAQAGYDPRSMLDVMKILAASSGGKRQPEFFSTHPNPENRLVKIQQAIKQEFPQGVPQGLKP
jgi:predicted Zn-dependent protease